LSAEEAIKGSCDGDRQMRLAGTGAANQDEVALLRDEVAAGEIAHQVLVDRCPVEGKVVDILGERQLGDGQLVSDRARLLLGDLGLEQIADKPLRLVLALDRGGQRLVPRVWLRQPEGRLRRPSCQTV
jgi:hypothetical protein